MKPMVKATRPAVKAEAMNTCDREPAAGGIARTILASAQVALSPQERAADANAVRKNHTLLSERPNKACPSHKKIARHGLEEWKTHVSIARPTSCRSRGRSPASLSFFSFARPTALCPPQCGYLLRPGLARLFADHWMDGEPQLPALHHTHQRQPARDGATRPTDADCVCVRPTLRASSR